MIMRISGWNILFMSVEDWLLDDICIMMFYIVDTGGAEPACWSWSLPPHHTRGTLRLRLRQLQWRQCCPGVERGWSLEQVLLWSQVSLRQVYGWVRVHQWHDSLLSDDSHHKNWSLVNWNFVNSKTMLTYAQMDLSDQTEKCFLGLTFEIDGDGMEASRAGTNFLLCLQRFVFDASRWSNKLLTDI